MILVLGGGCPCKGPVDEVRPSSESITIVTNGKVTPLTPAVRDEIARAFEGHWSRAVAQRIVCVLSFLAQATTAAFLVGWSRRHSPGPSPPVPGLALRGRRELVTAMA